jgi:hypothetical protein
MSPSTSTNDTTEKHLHTPIAYFSDQLNIEPTVAYTNSRKHLYNKKQNTRTSYLLKTNLTSKTQNPTVLQLPLPKFNINADFVIINTPTLGTQLTNALSRIQPTSKIN